MAVLGGFGALYGGNHAQARELFGDALRRAEELDDPAVLIWASNAASVGSRWGAGLPYASRAAELARDQGLLSILPRALERKGGELLWNSTSTKR